MSLVWPLIEILCLVGLVFIIKVTQKKYFKIILSVLFVMTSTSLLTFNYINRYSLQADYHNLNGNISDQYKACYTAVVYFNESPFWSRLFQDPKKNIRCMDYIRSNYVPVPSYHSN
jgi:hypothetical protein